MAAESGQTVRSIVFDISRRNRWPDPYTGRVLRNHHVERWLGREGELEAQAEEVGRDYAAARDRGDFDVAAVIAGEACGLIHDIPTAGEIVRRIVADAERLLPPRRRPDRPRASAPQGLIEAKRAWRRNLLTRERMTRIASSRANWSRSHPYGW